MVALNTEWTQLHNRFYADSGADEDALTALLAEDSDDFTTTALGGLDVPVHWRVLMSETSTAGTNARTGGVVQLQYSLNGGSWTTVNGSSSYVRSAAGQPTDGATLSRKLTQNGSNTFVSAGYDDVDGATASVACAADTDIEAQFCIAFRSADLANNDVVELRIIQGGALLNTYTTVPTITVVIAAVPVRAVDRIRSSTGMGVGL